MDFSFTEEQQRMRDEISHVISDAKARAKVMGMSTSDFASQLYAEMGSHRWMGIFAPKEYGGLGRELIDYAILEETLHYVGAPEVVRTWADINGIVIATLVTLGSPEIKEGFLPKMCKGEIKSSICWSEPDSGSDGHVHTTRATEEGDYFIVNGTKLWNESHRCTHTLAFVKTNPQAPRGQGHSALMIDLASPGISMSPYWMIWGLNRDETVFENVKVPKQNLVGQKNKGWDYWYGRGGSQCIEWSMLGNVGLLQRDFERFLGRIKEITYEGKLLTQNATNRGILVDLSLDLQVARLLYYRAWTSKAENGLPELPLAATTKVFTTELWQKLYTGMINILGRYGQLEGRLAAAKYPVVALGVPPNYKFSPALAIGGMPTEIERNIIASLKLDLPK